MQLNKPWGLKFWDSPEWATVQQRLKGLERGDVRHKLPRFDCLSVIPSDVRVVLVGREPHAEGRFATGHAFAIPKTYGREEFPVALQELFREYQSDLHYPEPSSGDLAKWRDQGVLLWNPIPTKENGGSLPHDWREYDCLSREVISRLAERGVVFCLLGQVARRYLVEIPDNNEVIVAAYPSENSKSSFRGSRIFTTINDRLCGLGYASVDWRLE